MKILTVLFVIAYSIGSFASEFKYYDAKANHRRSLGIQPTRPVSSSFDATLRMVRVPLPRYADKGNQKIRTKIGLVDLKRDHLLNSIDAVINKYVGFEQWQVSYIPEKVELITSARYLNVRFGAIAVYLGYRYKNDSVPSFYILEAGTAQGEAKSLFFSNKMEQIIAGPARYKATPFSSKKNRYRGQLRMKENEPSLLFIWSHAPRTGKLPYIRVRAKFKEISAKEAKPQYALSLLFKAQRRIALLAKLMRVKKQDIGNFFKKKAEKLDWVIKPFIK